MQQTLDGFHFERMTEAEKALLGSEECITAI